MGPSDSGIRASHVFVAFAASAITILLSRYPAIVFALLRLAITLFALWLVVRAVVGLFVGLRCPVCGRRGLARVAVQSFGFRYFTCPACGVRCKRAWLTGWQEASSARDQLVFLPKVELDPWSDAPGETNGAGAGTHGALLESKRRRRPTDEDELTG